MLTTGHMLGDLTPSLTGPSGYSSRLLHQVAMLTGFFFAEFSFTSHSHLALSQGLYKQQNLAPYLYTSLSV